MDLPIRQVQNHRGTYISNYSSKSSSRYNNIQKWRLSLLGRKVLAKNRQGYGKKKHHGDQESNNQHICTRAQNKSERNSTHMIKLQQCHVTGTILYVTDYLEGWENNQMPKWDRKPQQKCMSLDQMLYLKKI